MNKPQKLPVKVNFGSELATAERGSSFFGSVGFEDGGVPDVIDVVGCVSPFPFPFPFPLGEPLALHLTIIRSPVTVDDP